MLWDLRTLEWGESAWFWASPIELGGRRYRAVGLRFSWISKHRWWASRRGLRRPHSHWDSQMCGGMKVRDRMLKGLVADEKRGMGCKMVQWRAKVRSGMLNGARCVKTRNGVCKDAATGEGR